MWPESSSVSVANLVVKICYNSGDMEFFIGNCFIGASFCKIPNLGSNPDRDHNLIRCSFDNAPPIQRISPKSVYNL